MNDKDFDCLVEQSISEASPREEQQTPAWDYYGSDQKPTTYGLTVSRINAPWSDYVPLALVICVVQFLLAVAVSLVVISVLR